MLLQIDCHVIDATGHIAQWYFGFQLQRLFGCGLTNTRACKTQHRKTDGSHGFQYVVHGVTLDRYLTITQVGSRIGKAIKPTMAVAAISAGLLTFQRNSTARDATPISAVSQSPMAIFPSRTQAPRMVPMAAG